MKIGLGLFFIALLAVSCTAPKYYVKSRSDLRGMNLDQNLVNYIPLSEDNLRQPILAETYRLLSVKKYNKLDSYLSSQRKAGNQSPELYLAGALLNISRLEYPEAITSLKKIDDSRYAALKRLMIIDMNYEVAKRNNPFSYNQFFNDYQALADSYPDDTILKQIIALRLRYLRYSN